MELTLLLARALGIFSVILSISIIMHRKMVLNIFDEIFKNRALSYLLGIFETAAGLLLVLNHNIWTGTLETIITILGWVMLLEGVLYLFITRDALKKIQKVFHEKKVYYIGALMYLVFGLYLIIAGF